MGVSLHVRFIPYADSVSTLLTILFRLTGVASHHLIAQLKITRRIKLWTRVISSIQFVHPGLLRSLPLPFQVSRQRLLTSSAFCTLGIQRLRLGQRVRLLLLPLHLVPLLRRQSSGNSGIKVSSLLHVSGFGGWLRLLTFQWAAGFARCFRVALAPVGGCLLVLLPSSSTASGWLLVGG